MAPAVLDRPRVTREPAYDFTGGYEATLEDLVVDAWEGLATNRTVSCPVCDGALAPRFAAGPGPVGGRCTSCRTELS